MEQKIVGFEVDSATNQWWDPGPAATTHLWNRSCCVSVRTGSSGWSSASCSPCTVYTHVVGRSLETVEKTSCSPLWKDHHAVLSGDRKQSGWGELEGEGWGLKGVIKSLYKWVVMAAAGSTLLSKSYANTLEQLNPCATTTAHSRVLKPQLRSPSALSLGSATREVTALRSLLPQGRVAPAHCN